MRRLFNITKNKRAFWFILPAIILVMGVLIYPALCTFMLSTHNFSTIKPLVDTFTDPRVYSSLWKSVIFVAGTVILHLVLGLILALIANSTLIAKNIFPFIVMVPWVLSDVVTSVIWRWMLNPNIGIFNIVLKRLGMPSQNWLSVPTTAFAVIIIVNTWKGVALAFLFILSSLKNIHKSLYESACIDGAGKFTSLIKITLPMITPTLLVLSIIFTIGTFNLINIIYILTGGGPFKATNVIALHMYKTTFESLDFSTGASIAVLLMLVNLVFTLIYFRFLKKSENIYK